MQHATTRVHHRPRQLHRGKLKMDRHGTIAVVLFLTLTMHAGAQNATPATPEVLRVTRYADDRNEGSLRWAIEQSNLAPGRWRIEIVPSGTAPYVIKPA